MAQDSSSFHGNEKWTRVLPAEFDPGNQCDKRAKTSVDQKLAELYQLKDINCASNPYLRKDPT